MKVEVKENMLLIETDLQEPTLSASGKTLVVASSHGNVQISAIFNG